MLQGKIVLLLVIGKSEKPSRLMNVKSFSCTYKSQVKFWMYSKIFVDCFKQLDQNFQEKKVKVALIINS